MRRRGRSAWAQGTLADMTDGTTANAHTLCIAPGTAALTDVELAELTRRIAELNQ